MKITKYYVSFISKEELEDQYNAHQNSAGYALGQGLTQYHKKQGNDPARTVYLRNAVKPNSSFTVDLMFKDIQDKELSEEEQKELNEIIKNELKNSLLLLGLLGGLGSKNRRGLGSLTITELTGVNIPADKEQLVKFLEEIKHYGILSESPADIIVKDGEQNAWTTLKTMSHDMQMFRGWGFSFNGGTHKINGYNAEHNSYFNKQNDHDLIYQFLDSPHQSSLPSSFAFGLPRNYGLSNGGHRVEIKFEPRAKTATGNIDKKHKRSRRASSVITHIHQFPNGHFLSIQTIMYGKLFPDNDEVVFSRKIGRHFQEQSTVNFQGYQSNIFDEYKKYLETKQWKLI
ncbi:RAMP superfamily CRISPR-associated protein [Phocoenobacter skyensis]